jgi:RNA 2',3'-cyclic 3'-phosphodiesterase
MSIRCFLAINFSVAATRRLVEEVDRRKAEVAQAGAKVAWVPAANLHVTLAFLGSVADDLVEGIAGRLKRVAAQHQPLQARARGLGAFPSLERPSVLWIGAEADGLVKLQRDVEGQMAELGFAKEERPFHAHVTVGRVKEPANLKSIWTGDGEVCASTLTEIGVYESRTLQKGAEYLARARVPLGRPS